MHDEIRILLESPPTGEGAPTLDRIEYTLTTGYARALALDAERWRLERKIAELAAGLGRESSQSGALELVKLTKLLAAAEGDLTQLRGLLSSLRLRANEVRGEKR
jgi:hypothetical protein